MDGADAADAADAKDHAVEVAQVFGFHYKFDDRFAVFVVVDVDAADVGIVVGDDGSEFFQHAGAVVTEDGDFDGIALRATGRVIADAGPFNGDAAIALVEQVLHIGTTARMDGDALAASDVADDLFAADGIATPRAIDEQIILTFDLQRVRAGEMEFADSVGHSRLDGTGRLRLSSLLVSFGWIGVTGSEFIKNLVGSVFARAKRGEQIGGSSNAIFARDAAQVLIVDLVHGHFKAAGFALEQLAANFDGATALIFIEPVLDFVAGARTLYEM